MAAYVFELVIVATYRSPSPGYLLLCGAITLGLALAVGGVGSLLSRRIAVGLALWTALNGALLFNTEVPASLVLGAGFGLVTWLALQPARRTATPVMATALPVGLAVVMVAIIWPKVMPFLGLRRLTGIPAHLVDLLLFGVVVLVFSLYGRIRRRLPRLPSSGVAALLVFALLLAAAPVFWNLRYWQQEPGDFQPSAAAPVRSAATRPSLIILVMDTVRQDHLSLYGYHRDTTPRLQAFVEASDRARVFPLAFSNSTWSLPAHVSLLTGQLASSHGAHSLGMGNIQRSLGSSGEIRAEKTLAELLREHGYGTAAIYANVWLSRARGLERGFDVYFQPTPSRALYLLGEKVRRVYLPEVMARAIVPYPSAEKINQEVLSFLGRCGEAPCFVLANYMEAHTPWVPARPHAGMFAGKRSGRPPLDISIDDPAERLEWAAERYDEEIRGLDASIGQLLEELDRRGLLDESWLVITSDHGEAFRDHGVIKHGSSVYNDQVLIPLVVQPPRGVSLPEWPDEVDLLDVTATLAAAVDGRLLGLGRDLRSREGSGQAVQIEFFGNWMGDDRFGDLATVPARALVHDRSKLIQYPDRRELYDLARDLEERSDLSFESPEAAERLAELLPELDTALLASAGEGEESSLSPEEEEALRALGYIN